MNKKLVFASTLAGLFSAGYANAALIHDSSADPAATYSPGEVKFYFYPGTRILGGVRQTGANSFTDDDVNAAVKVTVVAGKRDIDDSERAPTEVILTWYADGVGQGDLDQHSGGATGIHMAFPTAMEHAHQLTFVFANFDAPASPGFAPQLVQAADFPEFSKLTNVTALSRSDFIRMPPNSTSSSLGASLDLIEIFAAAPVSIPEPATMGLLGMGLLGLGFVRRKIGSGIA